MEHAIHPGLLMPLTAVQSGRSVVLRRIGTGNKMVSRLTGLGLIPGIKIDVCRNNCNGPVVLGIHGGKVMLGRGMAVKLLVEENNK